jgi:hypothetical protein
MATAIAALAVKTAAGPVTATADRAATTGDAGLAATIEAGVVAIEAAVMTAPRDRPVVGRACPPTSRPR